MMNGNVSAHSKNGLTNITKTSMTLKRILSQRVTKSILLKTCCFVPRALNILITTDRHRQRVYPVGVHRCQWGNCIRYQAHLHHGRKTIHIGYFQTPEEAFYAYKSAKEQKVKELATQYFQEGKITQRVYQALMEYQVEITD